MTKDYGHYVERQPVSAHLKAVASGTNKNPATRQQKSKFQPEAPGIINCGDRSKTLWARRKDLLKKGQPLGCVETS